MNTAMTSGTAPKEHFGQTVIGTTVYQVYRLPVGENATRYGVVANFALEGPRGACYFVTDHGSKFQLNSVAIGGGQFGNRIAPRPLRGLTRAHLSLFMPDGGR